jgi:simple sugar transport system ATP-binding protein
LPKERKGMREPILRLENITKVFPGVLANDQVNLEVQEGEILALLGENGAGKSTLMNVLFGLYTKDDGAIYFRGEKVNITCPKDAIKLGIGMVHQHFMLIDNLTVAENFILGSEPTERGLLSLKQAKKIVNQCSKEYGLSINSDSLVADISVGEQQRLEILKSLHRGAKILILDEPTAVLTPQKVEELYKVLRDLKSKGHSIILITHKLKEIKDISDRVAVMRSGKVVGVHETATVTAEELAELMVGRPVVLEVTKERQKTGELILEVNNLHAKDYRNLTALNGCSLHVKSGEIVGIAGVDGNGQSELLQVLSGFIVRDEGEIIINNRNLPRKFAQKEVYDCGVGHIPEDRMRMGIIADFTVEENLLLGFENDERYSSRYFLKKDAIHNRAVNLIKEFDIRTPSPLTEGGKLSGGNQQKVILAREISKNPNLLIAAQPTRGLDVSAIEFVYQQLLEQRKEGKGILLISFELDEIFALSDRILVIYGGEIIAEFTRSEATVKEVGLCMAGVRRKSND